MCLHPRSYAGVLVQSESGGARFRCGERGQRVVVRVRLRHGDRRGLEAAVHVGVRERWTVPIPRASRQRRDLAGGNRGCVGELQEPARWNVDAQIADCRLGQLHAAAEPLHKRCRFRNGKPRLIVRARRRRVRPREHEHLDRFETGQDRAIEQQAVVKRHAAR